VKEWQPNSLANFSGRTPIPQDVRFTPRKRTFDVVASVIEPIAGKPMASRALVLSVELRNTYAVFIVAQIISNVSPVLARARITLAMALLITAIAVIGNETAWVLVPLVLCAIFLIFWGRHQSATEAFVKNIPFIGPRLLKVLGQIDALLVPQDRAYKEYIRRIIDGYDYQTQQALRILYRTRNSNQVTGFMHIFVADGFIERPKDGPGYIKPELRDVIEKKLDELGV
jgi:hypothetical protein